MKTPETTKKPSVVPSNCRDLTEKEKQDLRKAGKLMQRFVEKKGGGVGNKT